MPGVFDLKFQFVDIRWLIEWQVILDGNFFSQVDSVFLFQILLALRQEKNFIPEGVRATVLFVWPRMSCHNNLVQDIMLIITVYEAGQSLDWILEHL